MDYDNLKQKKFWPLAALMLTSGGAIANDQTQIDFLGYSAQGRYFAYEEFGTGDDNGMAFSQIFVVDLTQNTWVVGTPVRFETFLSASSLLGIREQVRANADVLLKGLEIDTPTIIVALNGDGEVENQKNELSFRVPGQNSSGAAVNRFTITLDTFETLAASSCEEDFGQAPLGFSLGLEAMSDRMNIFEDKTLPFSRGCPSEYRITGVVMPFGASDILNAVAVVSIMVQGVVAQERRFIVVPLAGGIAGLR